MKSNLFILFLLLCFFTGCKDAVVQPNDYPLLITKEVTKINAYGATFQADVIVQGSDKIVDYGFVWNTGSTDYKLSLLGVTDLKNFKTVIMSNWKANQLYSCKAYIQTTNHLVYGNRVQFIYP